LLSNFDDRVGGETGIKTPAGRRYPDVAETVTSMGEGVDSVLANERLKCARRHRNLLGAKHVQNPTGILRATVRKQVASGTCDCPDIQGPAAHGEHERRGVVNAWVAINDHIGDVAHLNTSLGGCTFLPSSAESHGGNAISDDRP
jgi:hypothetical protein